MRFVKKTLGTKGFLLRRLNTLKENILSVNQFNGSTSEPKKPVKSPRFVKCTGMVSSDNHVSTSTSRDSKYLNILSREPINNILNKEPINKIVTKIESTIKSAKKEISFLWNRYVGSKKKTDKTVVQIVST